MEGSRRDHTVDRSQVKHVKQHELDTADRLAELGEHVTFIPTADWPRPDVRLGSGGLWEFKSPVGNNRDTVLAKIEDAAKKGKQNFVLDLARNSMSIDEAVGLARFAVRAYPGVQVVWLIGRNTPNGPLNLKIGGE